MPRTPAPRPDPRPETMRTAVPRCGRGKLCGRLPREERGVPGGFPPCREAVPAAGGRGAYPERRRRAAGPGLGGHRFFSLSGPWGCFNGNRAVSASLSRSRRGLCRHRVRAEGNALSPRPPPGSGAGPTPPSGTESCCCPAAARPCVPRGPRPKAAPPSALTALPLQRQHPLLSRSSARCSGCAVSPKFLAEICVSTNRQRSNVSLSGVQVLAPVQQKMADGITLTFKMNGSIWCPAC